MDHCYEWAPMKYDLSYQSSLKTTNHKPNLQQLTINIYFLVSYLIHHLHENKNYLDRYQNRKPDCDLDYDTEDIFIIPYNKAHHIVHSGFVQETRHKYQGLFKDFPAPNLMFSRTILF